MMNTNTKMNLKKDEIYSIIQNDSTLDNNKQAYYIDALFRIRRSIDDDKTVSFEELCEIFYCDIVPFKREYVDAYIYFIKSKKLTVPNAWILYDIFVNKLETILNKFKQIYKDTDVNDDENDDEDVNDENDDDDDEEDDGFDKVVYYKNIDRPLTKRFFITDVGIIIYNIHYIYKSTRTFHKLVDDKFIELSEEDVLFENIMYDYNCKTTVDKFKMLIEIASSTYKYYNRNVMKLTVVYDNDDEINYRYFDIDEYASTIDDELLKNEIVNRRDKTAVSQKLLSMLLKANINLDCINYKLTKNASRKNVLIVRNINSFKIVRN